jgi:hypothetical protein
MKAPGWLYVSYRISTTQLAKSTFHARRTQFSTAFFIISNKKYGNSSNPVSNFLVCTVIIMPLIVILIVTRSTALSTASSAPPEPAWLQQLEVHDPRIQPWRRHFEDGTILAVPEFSREENIVLVLKNKSQTHGKSP